MVLAMKARVGNPLRKLVLIKLADNASDSGECWPAVATIAFECEISERSVQNHIKQLVADGFVRVEERRGANGVNRSNIYHLAVQDVAVKNKNPSYCEYAGIALAAMASVNRSTWSRVYSEHWRKLKEMVEELDFVSLTKIERFILQQNLSS